MSPKLFFVHSFDSFRSKTIMGAQKLHPSTPATFSYILGVMQNLRSGSWLVWVQWMQVHPQIFRNTDFELTDFVKG